MDLDKDKAKIINRKIYQESLIVDEGHWNADHYWHFILSKEEDFKTFSFNRRLFSFSRGLAVQQKNFSQKQTDDFRKLNFHAVGSCPAFNQATIFKSQRRYPY